MAAGAAGTDFVSVKVLGVLVEFRQAFFETTEMAPDVKLLLYCTETIVSIELPMMLAPAGTDQRYDVLFSVLLILYCAVP
jgi:hypothetical protein